MGVDPKEYTYLWKNRIVSHPGIRESSELQ